MKTRRQHFIGRGTLAMVAGWLLALLAGCQQNKQTAAPPPPPPKVAVAEVATETVPIVIEQSGTVKAVKQVDIYPRVTGYIFERNYTEGTFVDKDAQLYLIDPRPFQDRLDQLKAKLEGQKASLKFWQSEAERYARLAKKGAASVEEAEGSLAKRDTTQAEIEETKVNIRNAELDLSYTRITAPFYGRIQETRINVGNLVQKEVDQLTSLVQMDPIYVVFNLSRRDAFRIQDLRRQGHAYEPKDMIVEVTLPDGSIYDKKGTINFISYLIDPDTDTFTARGIFENPMHPDIGDFILIPGQYVPVRVTVGELPDALVIPQTAVVETQAGAHVYVIGPDNKAELRFVELGRTHGTKRVVTKGLKQGERVVAVGVQKVKSGTGVKPITAAGSGKDAPPAKGAS